MKKFVFILFLLTQLSLVAQVPSENYPIDSASVVHPGVPKGELIKLIFDNSKIFPGTTRDYWIYVPAQYSPEHPACVYVNQDGIQWNAPAVFDNLIFRKEMPVTIGVFITPGIVKTNNPSNALNRFNRSFEYDGLGDAYARFLLEEILPEVEKQHTTDGRAIRLSKNGNDRAIGGSSSGAVCAFTVAWERPAEFSKVFSSIGTYIGLRGAERYPTLIRKYEPRPIKIFLQDGSGDLNIYAGDWWMANQTMERALVFSGYNVEHIWGEGQHNGKQGTAIFPQAMRWLWKDWPAAIVSGPTKNQMLTDILIPGEDWKLVGQNYKFTEGTAANASGEAFFQDIPNSKTYKVDLQGKLTELNVNAKRASGTSFGPDGRRYVIAGATKQVIAYDAAGHETIIADSISGNDIVVANNGNVYVTSPDGTEKPSKLYLIRPGGGKEVVDEGIRFANGLTLSPDQTQLYVTESASHWVWIYQIQPDGKLSFKQHYGWLHVRDQDENAWSDGLRCDTAGRVYVTTKMGLQILDQAGRVNAIIPVPSGQPSNLCFGGKDFDILYLTSTDKVYSRKIRTRGANNFEKPYKPGAPKL
jgi:sugar lactone lactonase YvrE/predicted alpha/beta superfamily hydrolase